MSRPQAFKDLPTALAAFAAGQCKRWVMVDGWQIDLAQAKDEAGRVREEPGQPDPPSLLSQWGAFDRELHDGIVSRNVAAELARASGVLPDAVTGYAVIDLPELAVPSEAAPPVECCRACGRPLIGGVK